MLLISALLLTILCNVQGLDYSDLQALGVACPDRRDRCSGHGNNLQFMQRNCECDFACCSFKDCCLDALGRNSNRRSPMSHRVSCMTYGSNSDDDFQGIYVIADCPSNWMGSPRVKRKCEGRLDLSDPLNAAPVTSVAQAVTYRNRYCAECNHAHMPTLQTFQIKMSCDSLSFLTDEQIFADLVYNQSQGLWGVNRLDSSGRCWTFKACDLVFDVPDYLISSIRFCRHGLISSCLPEWGRTQTRRDCEDYMAVMFHKLHAQLAYQNVHCAICNNVPVDNITCIGTGVDGRKRPMSFALLLDVNQSDGDQVGMRRVSTPQCPADHKYDPFFKKCRKLVCALPEFVIRDGKCVPPPS